MKGAISTLVVSGTDCKIYKVACNALAYFMPVPVMKKKFFNIDVSIRSGAVSTNTI
jgi:hypothetical protein